MTTRPQPSRITRPTRHRHRHRRGAAGDKAAKITDLQIRGRKAAMVGDGVNDAPPWRKRIPGLPSGRGTDVAMKPPTWC